MEPKSAVQTEQNGGQQQSPERCKGTLGDKPSWMSRDQYEASGGPCRCVLSIGHDGPHGCEHTLTEWEDR